MKQLLIASSLLGLLTGPAQAQLQQTSDLSLAAA